MIINYDKLELINKVSCLEKDILHLNIAGDWAPALDGFSGQLLRQNKKFYGDLNNYFQYADLNIVNLETVLDKEKHFINKNSIRLIDEPKILSSLKSINTNLVCLANNHIMDNGPIGLQETIKQLKIKRISKVGAGLSLKEIYKPHLFEKKKQRIAIVNTAEGDEANEKYNNNIGASDLESYRVIDQIRTCRQQGYFTIVIVHAGVEFSPVPPPNIKKIYQNFVNEGANLVVGHHPHVPQGFEVYKKVPIFYSLGNFGIYRKKCRSLEKIGYILNLSLCDGIIGTIKIIPYQITFERLSILKGKKKSEFIKLLKKSSDLILDTKELLRINQEYIYLRRLNILICKLFISYFFDKQSYLSLKNVIFKSFSLREALTNNHNSIKRDLKYELYLKEYGCIKDLNIFDKILTLIEGKLSFLLNIYIHFKKILK